jgi:hypothetical protein
MKSIIRAACVGAAVLGAIGFAVVPASASPASGTAYDTRTLFLTDTPNSSNVACTSRGIYIAANTYDWQLYLNGTYNPPVGRSIYLESGNYKWADCIDGQNDGTYVQHSTLTNPQGGTASLDGPEVVALDSGNYTFGSQLSS